jgi:hypothetical protein
VTDQPIPVVLDKTQVADLVAAIAAQLVDRLAERPVLDVAAVQTRYGLADPRAARIVMHEAGSLRVGGRLFVRRADLERLEADRVERPAPRRGLRSNSPARPRRRRTSAPLEQGFWRE